MSTVDDLSYTPSAEELSRDAAQVAATGRRSWKTLKGRGEAVWPPQLEAALIEGRSFFKRLIHVLKAYDPVPALGKYEPENTKSSKTLGRFPMRNRFVSDYIYDKTGKRRTPKQVGSRLQQLRDTCKGKHSKTTFIDRISETEFRNSPQLDIATQPIAQEQSSLGWLALEF